MKNCLGGMSWLLKGLKTDIKEVTDTDIIDYTFTFFII